MRELLPNLSQTRAVRRDRIWPDRALIAVVIITGLTTVGSNLNARWAASPPAFASEERPAEGRSLRPV